MIIFHALCHDLLHEEKSAMYDVHERDVFGTNNAGFGKRPLPQDTGVMLGAGLGTYHVSKKLMRAMGADPSGPTLGNAVPAAAAAYAAYKVKRARNARRALAAEGNYGRAH